MYFSFEEYFSFCTRFLKENNRCYIEFIEELRHRGHNFSGINIFGEPILLDYTKTLYNNNYPFKFIEYAFRWVETKSGYDYWINLNNLFKNEITN